MLQASSQASYGTNVVIFPAFFAQSVNERVAVLHGSATPKSRSGCSFIEDTLENLEHQQKVGIYLTDGKGYTLGVNKTYENLTGIKATEIQGRHMSKLVGDGYFDNSVTLLVLKSGNTETIRQRILRTNQIVLATGYPVFSDSGEIIHVMTTVSPLAKLGIVPIRDKHLFCIDGVGPIIAESQLMHNLLSRAVHLAHFESTVLLEGPTGAGKEVIAKVLHFSGSRKKGPFIKVNMAALPEELAESELFGYEAGAFTGARKEGKEGLIKAAHHGTLFLDEIGEMPKNLQVKLLRVLQERELTPLGSTRPVPVDCRIIAATNRSLSRLVKEGVFREDLYYRLNVIYLRIPGLAERPEDVVALANHFMEEVGARYGVFKILTISALKALSSYSWPGNVRELQNVIERLVVLHPGDSIDGTHVCEFLGIEPDRASVTASMESRVCELEQRLIMEALLASNGDKEKAAKTLGIHRTTLFRKMQRYGLL